MKFSWESFTLWMGASAGVAGTLLGIASYVIDMKREPEPASAQIEKIQRVNNDLRDLMSFFEAQSRKISRSEEIVDNLRKEEESLRPMIDANRETIEAVLNAQSERQRQSIWLERIIGFLFGVAGSLIASVIWSRIQPRHKVGVD